MTTRTWNGTTGEFADGTGWSPSGAPQPGDTVTISAGNVLASALTLQGLGITVASNNSIAGSLVLVDSTIAANTTVTASNPNKFAKGATPTLQIDGVTTNLGTINLTGSVIQMPIGPNSGSGSGTLVNRGAINLIDASLQVQPASGAVTPIIENDGTITVTDPDGVYQSPVIAANITGTGTITLGSGAALDLQQGVGSGQTLAFSSGVGGGAVLQLEQPGNFDATIAGFVSGNTITISNTPFDRSTYTSASSQSGVLSLFYQGTLEGQLHFSGVYSLSDFDLSYMPLGGSLSNLLITTNVTNSTTGSGSGSVGSGAPGGSGASGGSGSSGGSGGGSSFVGAVYRFFDAKFGSHFFTADAGEKDAVLATRPDLVEEVNGFGDVTPSDPNAAPVFRFFDSTYGTHFFTSNAGERDGLIASRPDLIYEPNSTFYEHATQQAGDVAVYRLFDTNDGTQFLTGDPGEYNGITAAGSATFRADLRSEGIAFYAPAGTFT